MMMRLRDGCRSPLLFRRMDSSTDPATTNTKSGDDDGDLEDVSSSSDMEVVSFDTSSTTQLKQSKKKQKKRKTSSATAPKDRSRSTSRTRHHSAKSKKKGVESNKKKQPSKLNNDNETSTPAETPQNNTPFTTTSQTQEHNNNKCIDKWASNVVPMSLVQAAEASSMTMLPMPQRYASPPPKRTTLTTTTLRGLVRSVSSADLGSASPSHARHRRTTRPSSPKTLDLTSKSPLGRSASARNLQRPPSPLDTTQHDGQRQQRRQRGMPHHRSFSARNLTRASSPLDTTQHRRAQRGSDRLVRSASSKSLSSSSAASLPVTTRANSLLNPKSQAPTKDDSVIIKPSAVKVGKLLLSEETSSKPLTEDLSLSPIKPRPQDPTKRRRRSSKKKVGARTSPTLDTPSEREKPKSPSKARPDHSSPPAATSSRRDIMKRQAEARKQQKARAAAAAAQESGASAESPAPPPPPPQSPIVVPMSPASRRLQRVASPCFAQSFLFESAQSLMEEYDQILVDTEDNSSTATAEPESSKANHDESHSSPPPPSSPSRRDIMKMQSAARKLKRQQAREAILASDNSTNAETPREQQSSPLANRLQRVASPCFAQSFLFESAQSLMDQYNQILVDYTEDSSKDDNTPSSSCHTHSSFLFESKKSLMSVDV